MLFAAGGGGTHSTVLPPAVPRGQAVRALIDRFRTAPPLAQSDREPIANLLWWQAGPDGPTTAPLTTTRRSARAVGKSASELNGASVGNLRAVRSEFSTGDVVVTQTPGPSGTASSSAPANTLLTSSRLPSTPGQPPSTPLLNSAPALPQLLGKAVPDFVSATPATTARAPPDVSPITPRQAHPPLGRRALTSPLATSEGHLLGTGSWAATASLAETAAAIAAALDVSMSLCVRRVAAVSGDASILEELATPPPSGGRHTGRDSHSSVASHSPRRSTGRRDGGGGGGGAPPQLSAPVYDAEAHLGTDVTPPSPPLSGSGGGGTEEEEDRRSVPGGKALSDYRGAVPPPQALASISVPLALGLGPGTQQGGAGGVAGPPAALLLYHTISAGSSLEEYLFLHEKQQQQSLAHPGQHSGIAPHIIEETDARPRLVSSSSSPKGVSDGLLPSPSTGLGGTHAIAAPRASAATSGSLLLMKAVGSAAALQLLSPAMSAPPLSTESAGAYDDLSSGSRGGAPRGDSAVGDGAYSYSSPPPYPEQQRDGQAAGAGRGTSRPRMPLTVSTSAITAPPAAAFTGGGAGGTPAYPVGVAGWGSHSPSPPRGAGGAAVAPGWFSASSPSAVAAPEGRTSWAVLSGAHRRDTPSQTVAPAPAATADAGGANRFSLVAVAEGLGQALRLETMAPGVIEESIGNGGNRVNEGGVFEGMEGLVDSDEGRAARMLLALQAARTARGYAPSATQRHRDVLLAYQLGRAQQVQVQATTAMLAAAAGEEASGLRWMQQRRDVADQAPSSPSPHSYFSPQQQQRPQRPQQPSPAVTSHIAQRLSLSLQPAGELSAATQRIIDARRPRDDDHAAASEYATDHIDHPGSVGREVGGRLGALPPLSVAYPYSYSEGVGAPLHPHPQQRLPQLRQGSFQPAAWAFSPGADDAASSASRFNFQLLQPPPPPPNGGDGNAGSGVGRVWTAARALPPQPPPVLPPLPSSFIPLVDIEASTATLQAEGVESAPPAPAPPPSAAMVAAQDWRSSNEKRRALHQQRMEAEAAEEQERRQRQRQLEEEERRHHTAFHQTRVTPADYFAPVQPPPAVSGVLGGPGSGGIGVPARSPVTVELAVARAREALTRTAAAVASLAVSR